MYFHFLCTDFRSRSLVFIITHFFDGTVTHNSKLKAHFNGLPFVMKESSVSNKS